MALNGFNEEQTKEAGWVVQSVAGASAYIYPTGYDKERFKKEVARIVEHARAQKR